jgi:tetratricopeptide (TPR) repeat protein
MAGLHRPHTPAGAKKAAKPLRPEIAELLRSGMRFQQDRNFGQAAVCYREALARQPNQPDALHLLGTLALAVGDPDTAIGLFKRALATKSTDAAIHTNLAGAFLQRQDADAAEFHLRRALKQDPDNPLAQIYLADCMAMHGDKESARRRYEEAYARFPDTPPVVIGYAHICVTLGELETARGLYRKALGWGTDNAVALAGLAACEKIAPDSPEATEIERLLRLPGLKAIEQLGLRYAAGEIAERAGRYNAAFHHFAEAKKLGLARFDVDTHRGVCAALKSLFTPSFFAERKAHGNASTRPVFIVGMPRSGTTLTEQIIASHPDVAGAGELGDITFIAASLGFQPNEAGAFAKRVAALSPKETDRLAEKYLATLDRFSTTAARVTDKMPDNFMYLGLIALIFPNAKLVHCRRDPLDTCVSCFTTQLMDRNQPFATDLASLGAYYREYASLMAHWRSALPVAIFESSYERLIEAPEVSARALIDFIGLAWDPTCLAFHESKRPVETASRFQVRQPLYTTSVARWRRYESHLGPLKVALGDLLAGT